MFFGGEGQVIAIMLMALRVSLLAMITANMAAYFVEKEEQEDNDELFTRLDDIERALNEAKPSQQRDADLNERLDRIEKLLSEEEVESSSVSAGRAS